MEPGHQTEVEPGTPGALERRLLALLIAVAIVVRLIDVGAPLDRHFDGFQGAFFAVCAINYERLAESDGERSVPPRGAGAGYPVVNLDLDPADREGWYLYANHPPTVAWLAWAGLEAFAPSEWSDAWREGLPPSDFELALRLPFVALNLLGLAALFVALRAAGCRRAAWYATALYAWTPAAVLFGGLVNYENPSVPLALFGAAAAAAFVRRPRPVWWIGCGLAFAGAGAITYAPVFTAASVGAVAVLLHRRRGLAIAAAAVGGTLAPLLIHGLRARAVMAELGESPDSLTARIRIMVAPLLDGETPLETWLGVQAQLLTAQVGLAALALAAVGAAIAIRRLLLRRPADATDQSAALALALVAGGLAMQLAFYRHTRDPQDPFILHLVPGLAALGALVLTRASATRTPAGIGLALAATAAVVAESSLRIVELRDRWRGSASALSEASASDRRMPPPIELGPALAELVPAGHVVWYPAALGLNPATGLYAWRTLLPVEHSSYAATQVSQNGLGLESAPTWLAVPTAPTVSARASVDRLLADLEAALPGTIGEPDGANAVWQVWRIRN